MAQTIQIVPKYSFPYVETIVNDYTSVGNTVIGGIATDDIIRYIYPFISSKGVDNKFIRKRNRAEIVSAYGETNWKKYGQPLMQALNNAEASNSEVWCMRVMPDDAGYSHNIISAYYKGDTCTKNDDGTVTGIETASKRKFRIKYVPKSKTTTKDGVTTNKKYITTDEIIKASNEYESVKNLDGIHADGEGYIEIPGVISLYSAGRGKYGNNYRVRIVQDLFYEKDYGIKHYDFEIISTESGLNREATYVGTMITSSKYEQTTLINDVLEDVDDGLVPVFVHIDENGVEDIYNAYVDWVTALIPELEEEYKSATKEEQKALLLALIDEAKNIPSIDEFDILYGKKVASTTCNPFIEFPSTLTDSIKFDDKLTGEDLALEEAKYTTTEVVKWDDASGIKLDCGSDGSFETAENIDDEIAKCYENAFNGTYDKRIFTAKRIKANALWDANYPKSVKECMADLAVIRNDAICYLDCGIMSSFGTSELTGLITDYSKFDDYKISKNVHHYYIKESTTKKRVPVTITYFLSRQYADHILNYGSYIPFVKSYAQLSGHIKDTLAPSVEDFETDLKEVLTENRFNFFETIDDNIYQRATQNTSQMSMSDLLEESNVTTLYDMKRIIESDINDRLYDFSDAETRQRFRNYEIAKFANWSGREVESIDIDFRMNEWEAERSILHAYLSVTFRGLQKKAILEIDINKRASASSVEE